MDTRPGPSSATAALLTEAAALEARSPADAGARYAAILDLDPACLAAHNALERLCAPQRYSAWMNVNCTIDPRDDIFAFFARHPMAKNPIREYLSDGWRTLAELMLVMDAVGKPLPRVESMLEFAAGFGRFTRHLARVLPGRVACADVLPGTTDFLHGQFGVRTFASSHVPEDIRAPARYELVFVLSLFTHLPVAIWPRWIRALQSMLSEDGVLVFTTHSERTAKREGVQFAADGTFFVASSESPSIDADLYGTTFTTRAFSERVVQEATGVAPVAYFENAFWAGQDALVVRA
ncbi:MAG TPA: methyltransferase domain-containing protein [Usitatibacteraceae bacterium]|nr:methyltransferase domain-containing protein [Usitatibacteraceae bacterium]